MKKDALIGSIAFILVCSTITTPTTSKVSLKFGVKTGDMLEWKFTKFEGKFSGDKQSKIFVVWLEFVSTTFQNDSLNERIKSHGLFLGETLALVVVGIPKVSQYNRFPAVNGDFPNAIFNTPRDNESRSTAPYINSFPLIIPKEPDISHLYPNCIFNNQGVLIKAKRTVNWRSESYNSCLELKTHNQNSELNPSIHPEVYRIGIVLLFLGVWSLSVIYQKKTKKLKRK